MARRRSTVVFPAGVRAVDQCGGELHVRLQQQRSVVGVLHADVDVAAGAQRLVGLDLDVDVDRPGRHVSERDVRERKRRVGGDQAASSTRRRSRSALPCRAG